MSENSFKNSYVCPECYCADGWKTVEHALEQTTKILQEGVLASATLGQNLDISV